MSHTHTHATAAEPQLLVSTQGSLGRIRLNRPKALNSLTLEMIRGMATALKTFAHAPAIAAVLVDGAGERGLCAGGDIRAIHDSGKRGDGIAEAFWHEEYELNAYIAAYPKPYIAFMDGITMGGGVGISAHGAHRLVTERTRLAMPETGIGFFPDVGATWLLPRAPGEIGTYLGLTGTPIGAADAIYAGFADLLVPSDARAAIAGSLSTLPPGTNSDNVRDLLQSFALPTPPAPLAAHRATLDASLHFNTMHEILAALAANPSDFAQATARTIGEKSPTSLILTLHMLRLGRASTSLQECLNREFAAAAQIMKGSEFYEGVRAAIIDKDRQPRWQPASIAEIDEPSLLHTYLGA
ncbi:MAG: enoyl-CoA hydratase/isomerase family protein [Acidocella sp.]|nr:enoyl-CoA hydratase/isomerase family protein [Acidocella sp.]